ncbi:MAG: hypothetical protein ABW032_05155 [Burkholderiaceae bacterium]
MLHARLSWLGRRGATRLTVFTEPSEIDLPALYARLGAVVLQRGLDHRILGAGAITMLAYPVGRCLAHLELRRLRRQQGGEFQVRPRRRGLEPAHAG